MRTSWFEQIQRTKNVNQVTLHLADTVFFKNSKQISPNSLPTQFFPKFLKQAGLFLEIRLCLRYAATFVVARILVGLRPLGENENVDFVIFELEIIDQITKLY